ncbi:SDR family oxidoreductase [Bradyrhizobium pachyrhizi]|uniref:SDR family oxidoreductase n=1 Tax=Bradyrhizobium pachyrhizi TaxID=280333 RepID=A0A844T6N6_9BRAD|nr:SDR family oxidoreductase [Bradyrhizobium pachyrhizi]MVT71192.1 SDR family oxidoreductase [Bradyrhizobium pachyrhizi]
MISMRGKIAIVTGGTQGLGAAIAKLFAERDAKGIVTCGRDEMMGRARADEITRATGVAVMYVRADLAKIEDCAKVVAEADTAFGRVDALVNAAGDTSRGTIIDTKPELFDRIFAVNARAPFLLMQDTIKLMRRDKVKGTIVNISSMSAMGGQPFIAAYCASKGALDTMTRNTAYALLRNRIRVNGLNIGWMASEGELNTQRVYHGQLENWLEVAAARQPFARLLDPTEVARVVAFLSCDESGMMTGATINFDQSIWGAYDTSPQPKTPL